MELVELPTRAHGADRFGFGIRGKLTRDAGNADTASSNAEFAHGARGARLPDSARRQAELASRARVTQVVPNSFLEVAGGANCTRFLARGELGFANFTGPTRCTRGGVVLASATIRANSATDGCKFTV